MWRSQAEAEGLTLLEADNAAGYFGVKLNQRTKAKPYLARVRRGGKQVNLGSFATAEEAALCVARTPEGRAAAVAAASEEGNTSAMLSGATLKAEGAVPPMPPGAFVKEEHVPPLPPDAVVKQEHEAIVKEEKPSRGAGGMKRQRNT